MPEERIKVQFGDKDVDAVVVGVTRSEEPFSEYLLDDGTVIRRKYVMTKAARLVGEHEKDGSPIYLLRVQIVSDVQAPEGLMGSP